MTKTLPEPRAFTDIPGGRAAFDARHAEIREVAATAQARLAAALDRIGPPGAARWDPILAEIELRGRTLEAEQLGSFDGDSWLWSWANPYLAIPRENLAMAIGLHDAAAALGVAAFAVPMIAEPDEELPGMMGDLAVAHGFAEAYFIANQSQVYGIRPGQLALLAQAAANEHPGGRPAPHALPPQPGPLRTLALCFLPKMEPLADLWERLRLDEELAALPFVLASESLELHGPGLLVRVTRTDRLRNVMREAGRLREGKDEARRCTTVLTVETALGRDYDGCPYGVFSPIAGVPFGAAWSPTNIELVVGRAIEALVPAEALTLCERLNAVEGALVYDAVLGSTYPRR